ncbi:MAG: antitoxin VapB family protein [Thermoplasmata archaeon]
MSAKTVALEVEAYEMLRRQRRPGETFSEAVKRLSGRRRSILTFAGIWTGMPAEDLEKLRSFREAGRRRDRDRTERLVGNRS